MAIVRRVMLAGENFEPAQAAALLTEVGALLQADPYLTQTIEAIPSRRAVDSAVLWTAARNTRFEANAFRSRYPTLAMYGNVMLIPGAPLRQPHLLYQTPADRAAHSVTMLYGNSRLPSEVTPEVIPVWDDPYGVTDWINDYTLAHAPQGPYLRSESLGRPTTGATAVRHILYWIRIEETRLVPERFEVYDVPVGELRGPQHLLATIRPSEPEAPHPGKSLATSQRPPKEDATTRIAATSAEKKAPSSLVPELKKNLDQLMWGAAIVFCLSVAILVARRRLRKRRHNPPAATEH